MHNEIERSDRLLYKRAGLLGDTGWSVIPISQGFRPRDNDFLYVQFKIDGTLYTETSPEFYTAFEHALVWIMLKS